MKSLKCLLIFITLISTSSVSSYAQEMMESDEGFMDVDSMENGGYGAPAFKMTRLNGTDAVLTGARGAWIMNHSFALGGAGYVLANNVDFPAYTQNLELAYGGLTLDYIYVPIDKVALTAGLLVGGGFFDFNDNLSGNDGIYVAEPEVSAQYEFTKNFRTAITASYRGVSGVDLPGMSNDKLSGFAYGVALNFGTF